MNPDLRHPNGYTFPAGPKAPAPLSDADTWHLYDTGAFIAFPQFNLPRAIAAALQERGNK